MKTLVDIDDNLIKQAMEIVCVRTKKETVQIALEELIKTRQRQKLKAMAGSGTLSMSLTELKELRHRRKKLSKSLSEKS